MFDFKSFKDPIKPFIDEPISIGANKNERATLYIQKVETEQLDHYFMYWYKEHLEFVKVSAVQTGDKISRDNEVRAEVQIRLDQKYTIYGRIADNVIKGLESIGGFFESLMHIGMLLVFFFQERLFKSSFIKQLY